MLAKVSSKCMTVLYMYIHNGKYMYMYLPHIGPVNRPIAPIDTNIPMISAWKQKKNYINLFISIYTTGVIIRHTVYTYTPVFT